MAAAPIDLSAGLVPKPVDISAGLVPKDQPDTRSLFQKAKDNFNAATQGAQPGDGAIKGFIENVGQGGGQIVRAIAHPLDTLSNTAHAIAHPLDQAHSEVDALRADPSRFIGNAVGQAGAGAILGGAAGAAVNAVAPKILPVAGRVALLGKTPEAAYESALKPSTTLPQAQRAAIVQTGLENQIPVSTGGVEKIGDLINDYNQKIKATIDSDPTRPIDPNAVATRADAAKAKFAKQVNAGGDLAAIDASKQQFLSEQGATQGNPAPLMNASDAQEMKQGTYRVLAGKFGEQGSASVEAQKALARGLKEEIATQFPEINGLNSAESKLLDLQPVLERAVNRISNHQLIGIGTPVAGAAAKAVTGSGSVGVVASALKAVLDNPNVKSRLAIAVSKSAKIPYSQAAARVQSYSTALGSTAPASREYSTGDSPNPPTTPQP
jgi:hypothetical protein